MIIRKYAIPLLAAAGFAFAVYTVRTENKPVIPARPVAEPAKADFGAFIAGAGIIEASTQNIAVGTHVPGIATKVHVKVGDHVKAGDPLFTIDDRQLKAELTVRKAALAAAEASLRKLRSLPRAEEVPPIEALTREAEAQLADAKSQLNLMDSVTDKRAISQDELNRRRFAVTSAEARLERAKTDLALLKAGAWEPDILIAQAAVDSARAQVEAAQTDLDRLTVRAQVDGEILQVNIRTGEFAQAGALSTPLMLMGNTDVMHVRVDIDENDAWRFRPGSRAHCSLRGNASLKTDVQFVRVEPYVVPKRSLTGDSAERVDTRVLQVLYSFEKGQLSAYVGQQVDVFIEAASREGNQNPRPDGRTSGDAPRSAG
jgi:HlyD family secretion protein